jgi:hypothetical protein
VRLLSAQTIEITKFAVLLPHCHLSSSHLVPMDVLHSIIVIYLCFDCDDTVATCIN